MKHYRWQLLPSVPAEQLSQWQNVPPLMVQLAHNRGITNPTQFEPFITADERLLFDPFLLPDMGKAAARVYHALLSGEAITIYGDFDADGITGTVLLAEGLSSLGGKVTPYIPHRLEEGYGLNQAALERLHQQGITLIITVDCGITALAEVERAKEMGLDIIITDHHSVPPIMPPALATINPKRADSTYPFPELAGVGVAFKLLQGVFNTTGKELNKTQFLDLVALGTVADLVPLLGENRYLVKQGLEVLNSTNRLGLQQMVEHAGLRMGSLGPESIAYSLGPRLNAAGRLDHAITGYNLLATSSPKEASQLAAELEAKNAQRQRLTTEVTAKAKEKLLPVEHGQPLLMVGGEDYHAGVVGVAASKLAEEFHRPVFVLKLGEEVSQGSARSIPQFNIIAALRQCHDLLLRFGGHAQAAGFTLPNANIDRFHQRLLEIAKSQLRDADLRPTLAIDAEVELSSLGGETMKLIQQLAPFGKANPTPTFLSRRVEVIDYRSIGGKGEHLRLRLRDGNVTWHAIGFHLGYLIESITSHLDIVYNLRVEDWRGTELLELNILDFLPAD